MYEVEKYLSLTAHMWSGYWLIASGDFRSSLPADLKTIDIRNARTTVSRCVGKSCRPTTVFSGS